MHPRHRTVGQSRASHGWHASVNAREHVQRSYLNLPRDWLAGLSRILCTVSKDSVCRLTVMKHTLIAQE